LTQGRLWQEKQATTSSMVGVARSTLIRDSSRSKRPSLAAEQANSQIMQPLHLFLSQSMWRRSMPASFQHLLHIVHAQGRELLVRYQPFPTPAAPPVVAVYGGAKTLLRDDRPFPVSSGSRNRRGGSQSSVRCQPSRMSMALMRLLVLSPASLSSAGFKGMPVASAYIRAASAGKSRK